MARRGIVLHVIVLLDEVEGLMWLQRLMPVVSETMTKMEDAWASLSKWSHS